MHEWKITALFAGNNSTLINNPSFLGGYLVKVEGGK